MTESDSQVELQSWGETSTSDTSKVYRELGRFIQPYYQIQLEAGIARPRTWAELLAFIDSYGLMPTFIHELVHFYQFTATTDGIALLENYCALYDDFFMIVDLVAQSGSSMSPDVLRPPLYEWVRNAQFRAHTDEQRKQDTITDHMSYMLGRLQRKKGQMLRRVDGGMPAMVQEVKYHVDHFPGYEAGWTEFYDCHLSWPIDNDHGYVLSVGSDVVREGMARAIEVFVRSGFEPEEARGQLAREMLDAEKSITDVDGLRYFVTYYWLFRSFTHYALESSDTRHYTVETFVALCELALCWGAGNSSTARLFLSFASRLFEHAQQLPVLNLLDTQPFFLNLCAILGLDIQHYYTSAMDQIQLHTQEQRRSQILAPMLLQWQKAYEALSHLRAGSQSQPLLFLNFMAERSLWTFLKQYLNGIVLSLRDSSFPFVRDPASLRDYSTLIPLQDFILHILFERTEFTCLLHRERERGLCDFLREGNECNSRWPKDTCDYSHPCGMMNWLGQIWQRMYGETASR